MADNILRLRVDSQEYDAKLKKAAEGIRHLADVAHQGGGELTGLEKAELDYIRALGDMETKSRTASGQVRELSSTYKELKVVYDQLNEVEKADEGGKALAASLETLKQRAQEAKAQIDTATQSLNDNGEAGKGTSSVMEMLKDKFTVNIDAIKLFNIGLQAAEGALSVAKDAFFNNEEQLDEWGRVVESSHSLYTGFLNALNTGDISGYLSNINQIVQAARDAYDALDNLGTYNAFNQINVERTRTNMTESIADYRGGKGSKDTVKAAGEAYKKELQDRKRLENEAYLAAVKRVAAERGVSAKDLTDALSGTYGHYQDLKNVQPTGVRQTVVGAGMFARTGTETFAQTRQEKLGEALRHLNDTELQSLQALGAQAQRTGTEIAQVDKQLTRVLNGQQPGATGGKGGGRSGGRGGSQQTELQQNQARINTLTQEYVRLGDEATEAARQRQEEIRKEIALLEKRNGLLGIRAEQAKGKFLGNEGLNVQDEFQKIKREGIGSSFGILPTMEETLRQRGGNLLDDKAMKAVNDGIYGDTGKKGEKNSGKSLLNSISQLTDGLQKIGIDIPEEVQAVIGVIQGVMQVIEAVNTIIGATQTTALTANTAAIISLEAAIWANTAASAIPFANGGVVRAAGGTVVGNTYSGDQIPALLNAGEVVLNRSQVSTLASQLQGGGAQNMKLEATVSGEQLRFVLNNNGRRTGRGEYVQSTKRS